MYDERLCVVVVNVEVEDRGRRKEVGVSKLIAWRLSPIPV